MLADGKIDYLMEDYLVGIQTLDKMQLADKVVALEKPVYIVKPLCRLQQKIRC